jgi:hypothetical protein
MERHSERSFCCGAGGARMWMEENIGERINENRTNEAVGTGADQIAVGCPFCRVMLSDGLTAAQAKGTAREEVEVLDVAQMLLASVKGESATRARAAEGTAPAAPSGGGTATLTGERPAESDTAPEETAAPAGAGGGSLFDVGGDEPPAAEEPPAAAKPADSGGSLFDLGGDDETGQVSKEGLEKTEAEPAPKAAEPTAELGTGGSLFDIEDGQADKTAEEPASEPVETPAADLTSGGSLFDIQADEPAPTPEPKAEAPADPPVVEPVETPAAKAPAPAPTADLGAGGSLFDIAAPEPQPAAQADSPVVEPAETPAAQAPEPTPSADDEEPGTEGDPETEDEVPEPEEKLKPTSSGQANQPKTDVDISGTTSLFDL